MSRKIAAFVGQITQEYQSDMLKTIVQTANGLGYRLDVFCEFGSYGDNYLHAEGERNIIHLPKLEDYLGVVIAPDTFGVPDMERQLDELLKQWDGGPVVSIRQEKEEFYNVLIDNRSSQRAVVEHLITEHGFQRICYMTGKLSLLDARERYQGYLDAMEAHQLPVTEHMVFQGDYWREKGSEAVEWFLQGESGPEAIVCANDFMAISVLDALRHRGIRVPQDVAVTGFDDIEEARYVDPALTSVFMPSGEMGRAAVLLIHRLLCGEKVEKNVILPVSLQLRRSCGCGSDETGHWIQKLYQDKLYLHRVMTQNSFMNADFENCDSMEEILYVAYLYSFNFQYRKLYICFCNDTDGSGNRIVNATGYGEDMVLSAVFEREKEYRILQEKYSRGDLLPREYLEENQTYYLLPLHQKNHCLGYLVLMTDRPEELREFFLCWTWELSSYVDKIMLYEENQSLQEFRKLSTVDDLTGLFNRRKLEQELSKKLVDKKDQSVEFFIVSLDMDGLKQINDTYGHLEGDAALKSFGRILMESTMDGDLCCRVGGDEFTILTPTNREEEVEELLQRIHRGILKHNERSGKPYALDGSAGYARFKRGEELAICLQRADMNMYANKAAKKKAKKQLKEAVRP